MTSIEDRKKKLRDNQDFFSDKSSELSRYIGYSLVALGFAFISGENKLYVSLDECEQWLVSFSAFMGCVTVLLDYLQYISGWINSTIRIGNRENEYLHTRTSKIVEFLQHVFFYGKQLFAISGASALVVAIYLHVF